MITEPRFVADTLVKVAADSGRLMATYVLVHGGAHGGWCYQPVARILQTHGSCRLRADPHRVGRAITPALAGDRPRSPHPGRRCAAPLRGPARRHPRRPQLRRHGDHRHRRPRGRPDRPARVPRRRHARERRVARRRLAADDGRHLRQRRVWSTVSSSCSSPGPRRCRTTASRTPTTSRGWRNDSRRIRGSASRNRSCSPTRTRCGRSRRA